MHVCVRERERERERARVHFCTSCFQTLCVQRSHYQDITLLVYDSWPRGGCFNMKYVGNNEAACKHMQVMTKTEDVTSENWGPLTKKSVSLSLHIEVDQDKTIKEYGNKYTYIKKERSALKSSFETKGEAE